MFGLDKAEVFTTLDIEKFSRVITALSEAGIKYTTKTVNNGARKDRSALGRIGEINSISCQYYVYAAKADEQKARHIAVAALTGMY